MAIAISHTISWTTRVHSALWSYPHGYMGTAFVDIIFSFVVSFHTRAWLLYKIDFCTENRDAIIAKENDIWTFNKIYDFLMNQNMLYKSSIAENMLYKFSFSILFSMWRILISYFFFYVNLNASNLHQDFIYKSKT